MQAKASHSLKKAKYNQDLQVLLWISLKNKKKIARIARKTILVLHNEFSVSKKTF